MTTVGLLQPFVSGGIRSTNFYNGRLLSAEDLSSEQAASQQARALLGLATGDGIVAGLEVSPSINNTPAAPTITVYSGLAVNRMGHVLSLNAPASGLDLTLVRPSSPDDGSLPASAAFQDCQPPQAGVYVAGTLVYLLVVAPASATEGRLPVSGIGGIAPACSARFTVEGVQFRLLQLDVAPADLADAAHLRNLVAHACFGTSDASLEALRSDPFGPVDASAGYGLLDRLRAAGQLTDCDVPLAALHWTDSGGIDFVEMWAARRRLIRRTTTLQWPLATSDRRLAEAEATFLQFQDQMAQLRANHVQPQTVAATDVFRYLPPVGLLPISGVGAAPSFDPAAFFGSSVVRRGPAFIESARVEPLMRSALTYAPIDLQANPVVWLYRVRGNAPLPGSSVARMPAPYLIFTSGEVPFEGHSRYDEAHLDYGAFE